jgi:DNA-binding CsgD family transcriptional regulator
LPYYPFDLNTENNSVFKEKIQIIMNSFYYGFTFLVIIYSIREKEIFDLIIIGNSNKLIADSLNISVNTVKFHVKNIYEKLHIKSRKEAIKLEKSINL